MPLPPIPHFPPSATSSLALALSSPTHDTRSPTNPIPILGDGTDSVRATPRRNTKNQTSRGVNTTILTRWSRHIYSLPSAFPHHQYPPYLTIPPMHPLPSPSTSTSPISPSLPHIPCFLHPLICPTSSSLARPKIGEGQNGKNGTKQKGGKTYPQNGDSHTAHNYPTHTPPQRVQQMAPCSRV